jgi:hypothetical protein
MHDAVVSRDNMSQEFQLSCFAVLLAAVGCHQPPGNDVGALVRFQVVHDSEVFEFIQVFEINVMEAETSSGLPLVCSDIPNPYRIGDPELVSAVEPRHVTRGPPGQAVTVELAVPASRKLVIVVQGLAKTPSGVYAVAHGCSATQPFVEHSSNFVDIDVRATVGSRCSSPEDCESGMVCLSGQGFVGGYCAVAGCTGEQECPPGSACVSEQSQGGLCLQRCSTIKDCSFRDAPAGEDVLTCEGRTGPSVGECPRVCVSPLWNAQSCCPSTACGN